MSRRGLGSVVGGLWCVIVMGVALMNGPISCRNGVTFPTDGSKDLPAERNAMTNTMKPLTPEEERVIVHRGTEPPFSGRFWNHFEPGIYGCRRCGRALYRSENKFDAGCGWPSFDAEVTGAVRRQPDPDGRRTEIVCAGCGAHLGHVFEGERMTPRNVRHCVNSLSLEFVPESALDLRFGRAVFAGGCFWGVDAAFQKVPGVIRTRVGYTGGGTTNPTYPEVCRGTTGHAEAVEVLYDEQVVSYDALARFFFEIHDPTQYHRQGPDIGEQYRSAIFYANETQKAAAERLMEQLRAKGLDVKTDLQPLGPFWLAEAYHQNYYERLGKNPSCVRRVSRFGDRPNDSVP